MVWRLFILNLPYFFSESKLHEVLKGCGVSSVSFSQTIYGALASIETLTDDDLAKAETILGALKLPVPLSMVRSDTTMGQKLGETLVDAVASKPQPIQRSQSI